MEGHQLNLHLLVVTTASSRPNRLISALREAGVTPTTACAASESELSSLLLRPWDVLLCYPTPGLERDVVRATLQRHGQAVPVLEVDAPADTSPLAAWRAGVREYVSDSDDTALERLVVAVLREAEGARMRRRLHGLELDHAALARRHDLLLDESLTAYSYLQDGMHLYCNSRYAAIFGFESVEAVRTTPLMNLVDTAERDALRAVFADDASPRTHVVTGRRRDGTQAQLEFRFTPVDYQGNPCMLLAVQPAAGNAEFDAAMQRIGSRDLLTGLENLAAFQVRLEDAIRAALQRGEHAALVVLDIRDYADLDAALGKAATRLLLGDTARHLLDASPGAAVARLDEHEFGILLPQPDPDRVLQFRDALEAGFTSRISSAVPASVELGARVGMAMINEHARNAAELLRRAREWQRASSAATSPSYNFRVGDTLAPGAGAMLDYLQQALAQQRFRLVYQPVVHIKGTDHLGYEVLMRLLDADDNEVPPGAFLPLANVNGVGETIDRMVLLRVLQLLQTAPPDLRLILNLTNNTLRSPTFLPWLSEELARHRVGSDRLIVELSEIDLHHDITQATAFCAGLTELGLELSISHFGCALEPFAILAKVHPAFIKLDESLVRDLVYSTQQKAHVRDLISRLHQRHLRVVTPQVEDMDVLPVLWDIGADYAQGYCLQAPSKDMNYAFVTEEEITLATTPQ